VGEKGLEREWEEMEKRIKGALEESEKRWGREERKARGWWDKECEEKKKEARGELRKWRKGLVEGEDFRKRKKEYKEMCERKKKEENERWEREEKKRCGR
jgi:hypothetical protein